MAERERLITIHHLPGSGGTVVSKAVASSDGSFVLSEIHPSRHMGGRFHPLVQLRDGYASLLTDRDRDEIHHRFVEDIELARRVAARHGRALVVRDHAYLDFLHSDRFHSALLETLEPHYQIDKLASIRDPVDTYLSFRAIREAQGSRPEFDPDEFCQRMIRFADAFSDAIYVRHEDFAAEPAMTLRSVCAALGLSFNPDFARRVTEFRHFTGDSGRSGPKIEPRPRREVEQSVLAAFADSTAYQQICDRFGYEPVEPTSESAPTPSAA